ncbi:MAG: MauE/DoxX family redox-associated membrane protein [Anaerolineales bacterium]
MQWRRIQANDRNTLIYVLINLRALHRIRRRKASIFLTSALPKLRRPHIFTAAVADYNLLPKKWTRPFAAILSWLELATGLLLLLGWGTQLAAAASAVLLSVFIQSCLPAALAPPGLVGRRLFGD